jgi:hypothetical protein
MIDENVLNSVKNFNNFLDLLDIDVPLPNRSVSYSVMDVVLKDLYV